MSCDAVEWTGARVDAGCCEVQLPRDVQAGSQQLVSCQKKGVIASKVFQIMLLSVDLTQNFASVSGFHLGM